MTAVSIASTGGGCSEKQFAAPASRSAPSTLTTPTLVQSKGVIYDTALRPVAGVQLMILDGPTAGGSAISDKRGTFSIAVPPGRPVMLETTKNGYIRAIQTLRGSQSLYVAIVASPVLIEPGAYGLTLTADDECRVIPDELRAQTFNATVIPTPGAPPGTMHDVVVPEAAFAFNSFRLGVDGQLVAVGEEARLSWQRPPFRYFEATVTPIPTLVGTPHLSTVSMPFSVDYCQLTSPSAASKGQKPCQLIAADRVIVQGRCDSPDNRLTLTRR